ncbi:MAG: TlpA disulfide reductase family protein [Saprospiraceae bacterium]
MRLKFIKYSIFLFFPTNIFAQLTDGTIAPPFSLEGIYNNANDKIPTLESLKGKIIVLDFWAIWCSPCVAAIPEINELSKAYKDRNVQFIGITDDAKEKLENFMKKVELDFWVGRDDDKMDFYSYGVTGRPQMYVINRDGIIVYHGHKVTAAMLDEVIATNGIASIAESKNLQVITDGGFSPGEDPIYNGVYEMLGKNSSEKPPLLDQFILRHSLETSSSGSGFRHTPDGHIGITISGASLPDIYLFLHNISSLNWIRNNTNDTSNYDIIYWQKKKNLSKAFTEIEQNLSDNLAIKFESIKSYEPVNILSIIQESEFIKKEDAIEEGAYKAYTSIQKFVTMLEDKSNEFYLIDKSLLNTFIYNKGMDYNKMNQSTSSELLEFLTHHGIGITKVNRKITLYEINPKVIH